MSTRFEAAGSEYASRAGVSAPGGVLTLGGYVYLHALPAPGAYAPLVTWYGGFVGFGVEVDSDGHLTIYDYNGGGRGVGATVLSTGQWYYLWITQPSAFGTCSIYLEGATAAEVSQLVASPDSGLLDFATNHGSYNAAVYADVSLSGWKAWAADLAASNAASESTSRNLLTTTGAVGAWWMDGVDVTDHSGAAHDLTASGTLSAGPDSPVDGGEAAPEAYTLPATSGALPASGAPVGLRLSRVLPAEPGAAALEGGAAGQRVTRTLPADTGETPLTGAPATIRASYRLAATPGALPLAGGAAELSHTSGYTLVAQPGACSLSGAPAGLRLSRRMTAAPAQTALPGEAARLLRSFRLQADANALALLGSLVALRVDRRIGADFGALALRGEAATLRWSGAGIPQPPFRAILSIIEPRARLSVSERIATLSVRDA